MVPTMPPPSVPLMDDRQSAEPRILGSYSGALVQLHEANDSRRWDGMDVTRSDITRRGKSVADGGESVTAHR